MSVPRFLPRWLGGDCDLIDGHGVPLRSIQTDALPDRPEPIAEPLPEDLERLLRNPEIVVAHDRAVADLIRAHLRANPDATVTRAAYLMLFRLLDQAEGKP